MDADTDRLWQPITAAVEAAFANYLELKGTSGGRMKGRATVTIEEQEAALVRASLQSLTSRGAELKRMASRHQWQVNRLTKNPRRMKVGACLAAHSHRLEQNRQGNANTFKADCECGER